MRIGKLILIVSLCLLCGCYPSIHRIGSIEPKVEIYEGAVESKFKNLAIRPFKNDNPNGSKKLHSDLAEKDLPSNYVDNFLSEDIAYYEKTPDKVLIEHLIKSLRASQAFNVVGVENYHFNSQYLLAGEIKSIIIERKPENLE